MTIWAHCGYCGKQGEFPDEQRGWYKLCCESCLYKPTNGWRPIETAPKDGTEILVHEGNVLCHIASWASDVSKWEDREAIEIHAVGWMPLPEGPK